ncbi:MAG TPA: phage head closure protein [Methylophilus sp.]|uniref:phage head closure protein n=1 Tax=Methylophilus sp. TaxID=29541 RepID=UPI002BEC1F09|nr:phage head closure protein [Methylophilus sp.]HSH86887.1 phage head closure protein [Methylophilus sp.]
MSVSAGSLDQRITFWHNVETGQDAFGAQRTEWQEFGKRWANVLYKNGSQFMASNREQSNLVASARVRMDKSLLSTMRVSHDGNMFDIETVLPSRDRSYMDIVLRTINPETVA